MYLDDVDDDKVYPNPGVAPTSEEYDDMIVDKWPEDDDEEAIDKYLNVELILGFRTNDKCHG